MKHLIFVDFCFLLLLIFYLIESFILNAIFQKKQVPHYLGLKIYYGEGIKILSIIISYLN
jgi:hypothetical protein